MTPAFLQRNFGLLRSKWLEDARVRKKRKSGAFNIYEFKWGKIRAAVGRLTVRRKYEKVLFPRTGQEKLPIVHGRKLSDRNPSYELRVGKHEFVLREPSEGNQHVRSGLVDYYGKVLKAGVRFEQPVAIFEGYNRFAPQIVITRKQNGMTPLVTSRHLLKDPQLAAKIAKGVLFELGKMHGAGVTHGHLHPGNVLVNEKGNVRLVDPKLLGLTPVDPWAIHEIKTQHHEFIMHPFEHLTSKEELADLMIFAFPMQRYVKPEVWPQTAEAYSKGKELGRKRVEKLEGK